MGWNELSKTKRPTHSLMPATADEMEAIQAGKDRREKLERMYKYLLKDSTDFGPQPFMEFIEALKQKGYEMLVRLLVDGEGYHDYEALKKLHHVMCPSILEKLVVDLPLLTRLMASEVITEENKDVISRLEEEGRHTDAVLTLLRLIPRRQERWPALWIEALRSTGNSRIIRILFEDAEFDEARIQEKLEDQQPECLGEVPTVSQSTGSDQQTGGCDNGEETDVKRPLEDEGLTAGGPATASLDCDGNPTRDDRQQPRSSSRDGLPVNQKLKLRSYQKELAAPGIERKNAIICAPTGSGKTVVAVAIAENHLKTQPRGGRECVIFVVDTVHLMGQQKSVFETQMEGCSIAGMCGGVSEDNLNLAHVIQHKKIVVLTAQILLNSLQSDSDHNEDAFSIHDISLLILDECQNTNKKHPYNQIMRYYRKAKLDGTRSPLPQIIGLTASLGVDKASSVQTAIAHIEKMCANLDAIPYVVEEHKEELRESVPNPEMEMEKVPERRRDPFKEAIIRHMQEIQERMRTRTGSQGAESGSIGKYLITQLDNIPCDLVSEAYTAWVAKMKEEVIPHLKDDDLRMALSVYVDYLKIYHDALNINRQVRTIDALDEIRARIKDEEKLGGRNEVQAYLQERAKSILDELQPMADDPDLKNPLLNVLRAKILEYSVDSDACGIIFVQTRAAVKWLQSWINADSELQMLNPGTITGTEEMTKNEQMEVVENFRKGKHKCLVATSVAERGMDIPHCNWVIKYLHTTNEIALVQSKGRARKLDSRYGVVALDTSGKVEKEQTNLYRAALMNKAVFEVSRMDRANLLDRLQQYQRKEMRIHEMEQLELKKRPLIMDRFDLRCRKCRAFVTNSIDLRVHNQSHYTSIRANLEDSYVKIQMEDPEYIPDKYLATHTVHCKREECNQKWGLFGLVLGREMPLLSPRALIFVRTSNNETRAYKQWSKIPYTIPQFIDE